MEIVFASDSPECVQSAYSAQQLDGRPVCSHKELLAGGLETVRYLFSSWGMPCLSEEEIAACLPNLKAVFYAAGSVQSFARPFFRNDVRIFSAQRANAVPVAEFVTAQIVLANKGYFQLPGRYRKGHSSARAYAQCFPGNYGARIGLLGAGMVGRQVLRLLASYQLHVLVYDPFLTEAQAKELGVQKASLERVFATCPVVSNHLADNHQTKGVLGYDLFSLMGPCSVFINTGRGAQVVTEDLLRWAGEQPGFTALLDVTDPEPLPWQSPYWQLPNIFVTPHIAGSAGDEIRRLGDAMMDAYAILAAGGEPDCEVLPHMLDRMA